MKRLFAKKASPRTIKPFGSIIERPAGAPTTHTELFDFYAGCASLPCRQPEIGYLVARKHSGLYTVLETHLRTPELLVPLTSAVMMPLAPPAIKKDDVPDERKIRAFRIDVGQALLLHKGVWHWLPQPVGRREASILVMFAPHTSARDLLTRDLLNPVHVR